MHISNQLIKDQEYFHWFNKGKIVNTNLEKDEDSATNFGYEDHGHSFWPDDSPRTPTNNKKNGSGIKKMWYISISTSNKRKERLNSLSDDVYINPIHFENHYN